MKQVSHLILSKSGGSFYITKNFDSIPKFISFQASFLGLRNMTDCEFTKRLLNCMFFNTFVSERGPAWRACDLFDDLHQNIGEQLRLEEIEPSKIKR